VRWEGRRNGVVPVQVVAPHQADELRTVVGIRCVDAGKGSGEGVRIVAVGHGLAVVLTGSEQVAMVSDALCGAVVHAK
jgi:hypothetical protein